MISPAMARSPKKTLTHFDARGAARMVDVGAKASSHRVAVASGRIVMRARAVIVEKESSGKSQIVITEVPYQTNPKNLVTDIVDLVKEGKLTGISDLRNESDRNIRIVIDLKRDATP